MTNATGRTQKPTLHQILRCNQPPSLELNVVLDLSIGALTARTRPYILHDRIPYTRQRRRRHPLIGCSPHPSMSFLLSRGLPAAPPADANVNDLKGARSLARLLQSYCYPSLPRIVASQHTRDQNQASIQNDQIHLHHLPRPPGQLRPRTAPHRRLHLRLLHDGPAQGEQLHHAGDARHARRQHGRHRQLHQAECRRQRPRHPRQGHVQRHGRQSAAIFRRDARLDQRRRQLGRVEELPR